MYMNDNDNMSRLLYPIEQIDTLRNLLQAVYKQSFYGVITPLTQQLNSFFLEYHEAIIQFGSEKLYRSMLVLDSQHNQTFLTSTRTIIEKYGEHQLVAFVLKAAISFGGINYQNGEIILPANQKFNIQKALEVTMTTQDGCLLVMPQIVYAQILDIGKTLAMNSNRQLIEKFDLFCSLESNFKYIQKCFEIQQFRQGQAAYTLHSTSEFLYLVTSGEFSMSTFVGPEHPLMKSILNDTLQAVQQRYTFPLEYLKFDDFCQTIHVKFQFAHTQQVQTFTPLQYFGEMEILQKSTRYTSVECSTAEGTVMVFNWKKLSRQIGYRDAQYVKKLQETHQMRKTFFQKQLEKSLVIHILKHVEFKKLETHEPSTIEVVPQPQNQYIERRNPFVNTSYKILRSRSVQPQLYLSNKEKYESKSSIAYAESKQSNYPNGFDLQEMAQYELEYKRFKHPHLANIRIYDESLQSRRKSLFPHGKLTLNVLDHLADPKSLGRYLNFEGASSKVANYLKGLPKNIRERMMKGQEELPVQIPLAVKRNLRKSSLFGINTKADASKLKQQQIDLEQSSLHKTFEAINQINESTLLQSYYDTTLDQFTRTADTRRLEPDNSVVYDSRNGRTPRPRNEYIECLIKPFVNPKQRIRNAFGLTSAFKKKNRKANFYSNGVNEEDHNKNY